MKKIHLLISVMLMVGTVNAVSETPEASTSISPTPVSTTAPAPTKAVTDSLPVADSLPVKEAIPPLATLSTPLPAKADHHHGETSSEDIKQLIMGLISVIILIFILYFFVKKLPGMKVLGNPHMKVISVMNVGIKEKLALIQVGERVFLLGITQHNISYLHEFVTADVLFTQTQSADVNVTFQKMMQKIFERRPS